MPDGMLNFAEILTPAGLAVLVQVILIDLTMAGDNVVIMGTLTSGLPARERRRVIVLGVGIAICLPDCLRADCDPAVEDHRPASCQEAWCCCSSSNIFRELQPSREIIADDPATSAIEGPPASKTFLRAAVQIAIADLPMSLDNVLAVAAAAREHPAVLFVGLVLSVTSWVLRRAFSLGRSAAPLLAWAGLLMILYVALKMIWEGWHDVAPLLA